MILLLVMLVNLTSVQNFIAHQVTQRLSDKLKTTVTIDHIQIDPLNHLYVKGIYIEGLDKDTLLYAGEIDFRITDWFIFTKGTPVIKYIGLHNAYVNLYRTGKHEDWNYQFIVDAFSSGKTTAKKQSNPLDIDLKEVDIKNVRFYMDDEWAGTDLDFEVGSFHIDADKIDLKKKIIEIGDIKATSTRIVYKDYDGGRPPQPKAKKTNEIDTTAFNPDKWNITISGVDLQDCFFSFDNGKDAATPNEFDPAHIAVSNIQLNIKKVQITGDTITAELDKLAANERCGFTVKKLKADVRLSPTETICDNLLLQTNNSNLGHYYAMHYKRFPDFLDYINLVVMDAHLKKSTLDSRDVAYFAPELRAYPSILNVSGDVKGTVADIDAKNLYVNDGYTTIKGNLNMKGLPDIETTYIDYRNGEFFTSGEGIFKYAPALRHDKNVAYENITRAYFKGDFKGYINNFVVDGTIVSNLGTIVSDVKMKIPAGKGATTTYSGNVHVNELNLGSLLRQPDLGTVTLKADVKGTESKADGVAVDFATIIDHFEYKGYAYQGINADGKLEKQKFTGNLLISDPNVSLGFYGLFDFSDKKLKINAKANLLQSNLAALHLVKDEVTLVADFDLDWEGNSIDDFTGYAKMYNINLVRNSRLLDLDSIYINATETGENKLLTIQSNAFTARIQGNYELSTLPLSFQYYVSGYLPNYIKAPDKSAPEQDIRFELVTNDLDSLFAVFMPSMSGFNSTTIDGYLSTAKQQLELNANIQAGRINGITFLDTKVTAKGSFKELAVNADVGKVILTDTSMHGTLKLNTTLGNDKLTFDITTASANALGDAIVRGQARAHGDTMDMSIAPSEFYMNSNKWVIAGGNTIVFTDGYLSINDFKVSSGPEMITINSNNNGLQQSILATITNLDASELGKVAGLSDYEIKGSINGSIKADNIFSDMYIAANLKATGIEIGKDTIGNINVSGSYDGKNHLVSLDEQTGIFRGDNSLTASGKLSFDSSVTQKIDAQVNLNHMPLSWISPLLRGFVSNINGTANGKVTFKGTSETPDIEGKINLEQAGIKIDFLGATYTIPDAAITLNNKTINVGRLTLHDRFQNTAYLTGGINHNRFKKFVVDIAMNSQKFEVIDLKANESDVFYGNLIAKFENLTVKGPFDDIAVKINRAQPAQKSHLYLPLSSGSSDLGAYSYITFKKNGDTTELIKTSSSKLSISIDAIMNPLAEITMIMDPATGDAINATGSGTISMEIPPNNEIRMYGNYTIESGNYTFTLPQLFFKRKFQLYSGSLIQFEGPIDNTQLNVGGIYSTRARLYDLLSPSEKSIIEQLGDREISQAKNIREIDVILTMKGSLGTPELSFKIDVPDKSGAGTIAYKKLERVNADERELFNQVASLLLVNTFIASDGGLEGGATSGVVNNVSDIFSGTASSQLTNLLGRLTGDENIAINLKYQKYNFGDNTDVASGSRNALSLGLKKNLFKDRLTIEVGSSLDWGKPTSSNNATTFNPVGDFRLQYLLKEGGNLRGNIFRTSNYDVLAEQNITRGGVGLSWRRSFNTLGDFFGGSNYMKKEEEDNMIKQEKDSTSNETSGGTD